MKNRIITLVCFAVLVIVCLSLSRACNPYYRGELELLKQERNEVLKELSSISNQRDVLIAKNRELLDEVARLAAVKEKERDSLLALLTRERHYETRIDTILYYSDPVMDSLFRARYPEIDSALRR